MDPRTQAVETFAVGYEIERKALGTPDAGMPVAAPLGPQEPLEPSPLPQEPLAPLGGFLRAPAPLPALPRVHEDTFAGDYLLEDRWRLVARTMQHVARMETELSLVRAHDQLRRDLALSRRLAALEARLAALEARSGG